MSSNLSPLTTGIVDHFGHGPVNQRPIDNSTPFNPKRRYAILFNEGPGYLLVDSLKAGAYSDTMLVQSLADGQIYVRKLHDVQFHRPGAQYQVDDLENMVSHPNVPKLTFSREYNQTIYHPTTSNPIDFTTPVTLWQYCNGDRLFDLMSRFDWDENEDQKLPEAVIWSFMSDAIKFFLDISARGICHNDIHGGNVMFNYPDGAVIPEMMFLDFGLAERYPTVSDLRFRQPFTGEFDSRGLPISNILTAPESTAIRHWYATFCHDQKHLIGSLHSMIFCAQDDKYYGPNRDIQTVEALFGHAAAQREGINGYSPLLIMTIRSWSSLLENLKKQPLELRAQLERLAGMIQRGGASFIQEFTSHPETANEALAWMKPPPFNARPAIWKDPIPFLHPDNPADGDDIRINRDEENTDMVNGDYLFEIYRHGDWALFDPAISVDSRRFSSVIILRRSQFRVVELDYDFTTHRWVMLRTVESMVDCPDLSPDSPPQRWDAPVATFYPDPPNRRGLRLQIPNERGEVTVDGRTLSPRWFISPDVRREDFINSRTVNRPVYSFGSDDEN